MASILIRGPFTEAEMRRIVLLLQDIEGARPEETFEVFIDSPQADAQAEEFLEAMNPLRPGYERVVRYRDR